MPKLCGGIDKKSLVCPKGGSEKAGCISRLLRTRVDTTRINASSLANDLVNQSDRQSAEGTCARPSICPEQDSFQKHLDHVYNFFLLWQTGSGCRSDKVICISPHTDSHTRGTDIHPHSPEQQICPNAFCKGAELRDSC